jgi:hypothetical protein
VLLRLLQLEHESLRTGAGVGAPGNAFHGGPVLAGPPSRIDVIASCDVPVPTPHTKGPIQTAFIADCTLVEKQRLALVILRNEGSPRHSECSVVAIVPECLNLIANGCNAESVLRV